jgi:hypothetical protein
MTKVREPSSIVEMAERCRQVKDHIRYMPEVDAETRRTSEEIAGTFAVADFYELNAGITTAVNQMYNGLFGGKNTEGLVLDQDCRLPSSICVFWAHSTRIKVTDFEEPIPFAYYAAELEGITHVYLISPYFTPLIQGGYEVGSEGGILAHRMGEEEDMQRRAAHILTVAAMCSVLNQPSFTKREPAGSRQERRAANRSGGYATDAWHKITWNIGEEVKAKLTRDEPVRCMPLHYTRGHWRRAEEGWKNTTQRKDGLWYQWIEGFWSGHPAFGIKKSYHAPKMGDAA